MKILIAASIQGDGSYEEEELTRLLDQTLRDLGHTVDYFFLPYERNILSLPDQILAYQLLRIEECDQLITIGYPACMLRHPNKTVYLFQTEPMLAEYWDSAYGVLANYQYSSILLTIRKIEEETFSQARRVFCGTELLTEDLRTRFGLSYETLLYPPLPCPSSPCKPEEEPYIACESALLPWQRWELLRELSRYAPVRLYVPNAHTVYLESAQRILAREGLEDRIRLMQRRCGREELEGAAMVAVTDYQARRISNLARQAMGLEKPVAAMEDSGALCALLPPENIIPSGNIPTAGLRQVRPVKEPASAPDAAKFARELLK